MANPKNIIALAAPAVNAALKATGNQHIEMLVNGFLEKGILVSFDENSEPELIKLPIGSILALINGCGNLGRTMTRIWEAPELGYGDKWAYAILDEDHYLIDFEFATGDYATSSDDDDYENHVQLLLKKWQINKPLVKLTGGLAIEITHV